MISPKRLQYVLLLAISLLVFYNAYAQTIDEKAYQHKMHLMDSLSLYKMDDYDTLYQISVLYPSYGRDFRSTSYGWCNKWNEKKILFININGTEHDIDKKQIISINPVIINNSTMEAIIDSEKTQFPIGNFGKKYLLNLWLYKKGQFDFSKQMLPKNDKFFDDSYLRDDFGIVYYNAMLEAFTGDRDYPKQLNLATILQGVFSTDINIKRQQ